MTCLTSKKTNNGYSCNREGFFPSRSESPDSWFWDYGGNQNWKSGNQTGNGGCWTLKKKKKMLFYKTQIKNVRDCTRSCAVYVFSYGFLWTSSAQQPARVSLRADLWLETIQWEKIKFQRKYHPRILSEWRYKFSRMA